MYADWENRCKRCKGSYGYLNENGSHNTCDAFAKRGLPTPNLGERCRKCLGDGYIAYSKRGMGSVLGPKCEECDGQGYHDRKVENENR